MLDRDRLRALRESLAPALASIGAAHGVELTLGTLSYGATRATARLTVTVPSVGEAGDPSAREGVARAAFAKLAPLVGLSADDYGARVVVGTAEFTLVGIVLSRPKYPITGRNAQGIEYRLPLAAVRAALAHQADRAATAPVDAVDATPSRDRA